MKARDNTSRAYTLGISIRESALEQSSEEAMHHRRFVLEEGNRERIRLGSMRRVGDGRYVNVNEVVSTRLKSGAMGGGGAYLNSEAHQMVTSQTRLR